MSLQLNIQQIISELQKPVSRELLSQKRVGGQTIDYIAWFDYCDLLDFRVGAGFWNWEVISINTTDDRLFITGKLTIHGEDRSLSQMSTGTELLNCSSYGDPSSNAEAMALRRCCAKFGLARDLWRKNGKTKSTRNPNQQTFRKPSPEIVKQKKDNVISFVGKSQLITLLKLVEQAKLSATEVSTILQGYGFDSSAKITLDKFPAICSEIKSLGVKQ